MSGPISPNTQAILLLTAPLLLGPGPISKDLLKPAEYRRLAFVLRERKKQPADLLVSGPEAALNGLARSIDLGRIERLLARGFLLSQALERWQTRAIWVLSRADEAYPKRLKIRMRENAPALLYGCGDRDILNSEGLAVVGPRNADEALVGYAAGIGRLAARAGQTLISGGARGVDLAAMRAAAESRGRVVGVLAEDLERAAMDRDNRDGLMGGRLVLVSEYDPNSRFTVGHAMERNKLIYAFAKAALVVNAEVDRGGTWAGAMEQLERLHFTPVFVRSTGAASPGLEALRARGAQPWPNPEDADALRQILESVQTPDPETARPPLPPLVLFPSESIVDETPRPPGPPLHPALSTQAPSLAPGGADHIAADQRSLGKPRHFVDVERDIAERPETEPARSDETTPLPAAAPEQTTPAEQLFLKVRELASTLLVEPKTEAEVARLLEVSVGQAKEWLRRLVNDGVVERRARPTRYGLRLEKAALFRIEVIPSEAHPKQAQK